MAPAPATASTIGAEPPPEQPQPFQETHRDDNDDSVALPPKESDDVAPDPLEPDPGEAAATPISPLTAETVRDFLVPPHHRRARTVPAPKGPERLPWRHRQKSAAADWQRFNSEYNSNINEHSAWLIDCQIPLLRMLGAVDEATTDRLEEAFPGLDRQFGASPIRAPAPYLRRQRYGFGRDHCKVSSTYESHLSPFTAMHFAWDFLAVADRRKLASMFPPMTAYSNLRRRATYLEIDSLRASRGKASEEDLELPVDKRRSYKMAVALLRFDFIYPRLIRWLGGLYTYEHRNFEAVWDVVEHCAEPIPVPPGYPKVDYNHAWKLFDQGAPLESHFNTKFEEIWLRERYDNHPPLQQVLDKVIAKFNKEERLSYHVLLPRSLWAFIPGLVISPMNFVQRPGDPAGRICVDPSSRLPSTAQFIAQETLADESAEAQSGKENAPPRAKPPPRRKRPRRAFTRDTAAPNLYTPDTGAEGAEDINPKVYYATALKRFLTWIWRLRMDHPDGIIYLSYDDISAAFHRILYHPEIAKVYSMVFMEWLVIPTGLIFGAKNSPSLYMVPAELRAHMAAVVDVFDRVVTELAAEVRLVVAPTQNPAPIPRAIPDAMHGPISEEGGDRAASFVDDTGLAGTPDTIRNIINRSILAAYLTFGFPDESDSQPVINAIKFPKDVSEQLKYLGFEIDSQAMMCEWPLEKREKLAGMLDDYWLNPDPSVKITPSRASRPLGLIRHGAPISVLGVYHSMRLQHSLNDALSKVQRGRFGSKNKRAFRNWWNHHDLGRDVQCELELRILRPTLTDLKWAHIWRRPIGLMVRRQWTIKTLGDASYQGLGGFCTQLRCMWRLSREDLQHFGFPMHEDEPLPGEDGTHINILEFIALIIGLWLALTLAPPGSQPVLLATGDNTSALSWMYHASRTKTPVVRRLARFCQALLTYHPHHFALQKEHVKGVDNEVADVLSRFKRALSWARAIELTWPALNDCQPYQVPSELLTALQSVATSEKPADWYVTKTTELWTIGPTTLPSGWQTSDTMTSRSST